jgi:hypothetical protein
MVTDCDGSAGRRPCVLSLATRQPFAARLDRLHRSLRDVGFAGDFQPWAPGCFPAGCPPHDDVPFAFKPFCFAEARRDRELLLWMDARCVAVRPLEPLFEHIAVDGYVLFQNRHHRVGQWVSDATLAHFELNRDDALELAEVNAAAIGLDLANPVACAFLERWHAAAQAGLPFRGVPEGPLSPTDYADVKWNRSARVSADERVRGHRHDQSVAGLVAHRLGMRLTADGLRPFQEGSVLDPGTVIAVDRQGLL